MAEPTWTDVEETEEIEESVDWAPLPRRRCACGAEVLDVEVAGEPVQLEVDELDPEARAHPWYAVAEDGAARRLPRPGLAGTPRQGGEAVHALHRCTTLRGRR